MESLFEERITTLEHELSKIQVSIGRIESAAETMKWMVALSMLLIVPLVSAVAYRVIVVGIR